MNKPNAVSAQGLSKTYPTRRGPVAALSGVDLEVPAGRFLALRGPSGCGKTTLLLMLGGLLHPDHGDLEVDGVAPYALGAEARTRFRARKVGFVFQDFNLIPYLDVEENILSSTLTARKNERAQLREQAHALMDRLGLSARRHHRPGELSAGEQQRGALARAMLRRPALILADEPTGNLDAENAGHVLEALRDYSRQGQTVIMVSHEEAAIAAADECRAMAQGQWV